MARSPTTAFLLGAALATSASAADLCAGESPGSIAFYDVARSAGGC